MWKWCFIIIWFIENDRILGIDIFGKLLNLFVGVLGSFGRLIGLGRLMGFDGFFGLLGFGGE